MGEILVLGNNLAAVTSSRASIRCKMYTKSTKREAYFCEEKQCVCCLQYQTIWTRLMVICWIYQIECSDFFETDSWNIVRFQKNYHNNGPAHNTSTVLVNYYPLSELGFNNDTCLFWAVRSKCQKYSSTSKVSWKIRNNFRNSYIIEQFPNEMFW